MTIYLKKGFKYNEEISINPYEMILNIQNFFGKDVVLMKTGFKHFINPVETVKKRL